MKRGTKATLAALAIVGWGVARFTAWFAFALLIVLALLMRATGG